MGIRCLLGHDFGDPELEREREEQGDEVVVTVSEQQTCTRCGATKVVSENTEVTSLEQLAETADDEAVEAAEAEIGANLQGLEAGDEATYERVGEVVDTVLAGMQDCRARLPAPVDHFVKQHRLIQDRPPADVAFDGRVPACVRDRSGPIVVALPGVATPERPVSVRSPRPESGGARFDRQFDGAADRGPVSVEIRGTPGDDVHRLGVGTDALDRVRSRRGRRI